MADAESGAGAGAGTASKGKDASGGSAITTALKVLLGIGALVVVYYIATAVSASCVDESGKEIQNVTCSVARGIEDVGEFIGAAADNMGAIIGAVITGIVGAAAVGVAKYTGGGGNGGKPPGGGLGGETADPSRDHTNPDDGQHDGDSDHKNPDDGDGGDKKRPGHRK